VPARAPIRNLRFWILALLFASTLVNYVDRQVLSLLKPTLSKEFGWNEKTYAAIVMAFQVAYAIAQTGSGWVIDRIGTRLGMALTVTVWSLAGIATAFARSVFSFGVCRFFLGLGEAGNWPGSTKATREWFEPRDRAFATGVWNTGSATGAVIAGFMVPPLANRYGWPSAFVATGVLGFVWLAAWLAFYRRPADADARDLAEEAGIDAVAASRWSSLLKQRDVWALIVARFVSDPVWWFYIFWLPGYLADQRGMTLLKVGALTSIPWIAADLGSVAGGCLSSWLIRRGFEVVRARKVVMVVAACLMPCGLFAVRAEASWLLMTLVSIATFGHQFWASSILTLPADLFRGRVVASCSGLTGTGATIGGILATSLTGRFVDAHHSYTAIFTWAGLMHPLAAVVILLLIRRRPDATPSTSGSA